MGTTINSILALHVRTKQLKPDMRPVLQANAMVVSFQS